MTKHLRRLTVLVVLAAVVAACQSIPAVGSLVPLGENPLVSVTVRGGECPQGPCGATTVIERDGRVHQTGPVAAEMGALSGELLTTLETAVRTTDFDVVRARRFTGECPVNFDGQEMIYEFGAPGGIQRIATCETDVDPNHPLFKAVTAAMLSFIAEPS